MRVPDGFELLEGEDGSGLLLRREMRHRLPDLEPALLGLRLQAAPVLARSGRGTVLRLELPDGSLLAVRSYRHGGLLGGWLGASGISWQRAVGEVEASEAARGRGVSTPPVVAVYFRKRGFREPVLLTSVVPGRGIGEIAGAAVAERRAAARALAACLADLLAAGVDHPDLNLTNFVIDLGPPARAHVLDFDGARVVPHLSLARKAGMVRRLCRSRRKWQVLGLPAGTSRDALCLLIALGKRDALLAGRPLWRELGRPFPWREIVWRWRGR